VRWRRWRTMRPTRRRPAPTSARCCCGEAVLTTRSARGNCWSTPWHCGTRSCRWVGGPGAHPGPSPNGPNPHPTRSLQLYARSKGALPCTATHELRVVTVGVSGGRSLTRPFRDARQDFPLQDGIPYSHVRRGAGVWDLSIVQGPFSVAPCRALALRFAMAVPCLMAVPCRPRMSSPLHRATHLRTRFAALPTDICPQRKEAQPLSHALTFD
jgi:hypothetical protein